MIGAGAPVVIYVNGSASVEPGTDAAAQSCRETCANPGRVDPWQVARAFPDHWWRYIRDHYRALGDVMHAFGVCETTARKWWTGMGGAHGRHVAVELARNPAALISYLVEAA